MRVELRDEAREDLAVGAWFYERQKAGLVITSLNALPPILRSLSRSLASMKSAYHALAPGFEARYIST